MRDNQGRGATQTPNGARLVRANQGRGAAQTPNGAQLMQANRRRRTARGILSGAALSLWLQRLFFTRSKQRKEPTVPARTVLAGECRSMRPPSQDTARAALLRTKHRPMRRYRSLTVLQGPPRREAAETPGGTRQLRANRGGEEAAKHFDCTR